MTCLSKRPRGRPRGTGLDDCRTLARVADLMASGEAATKTAAIHRIAGPNPSVVRRLQRKFRDYEPRLMTAAAARAQARGVSVHTPYDRPVREALTGYNLVRLWDDIGIWNQYGIAVVGGLALFVVALEAVSWWVKAV